MFLFQYFTQMWFGLATGQAGFGLIPVTEIYPPFLVQIIGRNFSQLYDGSDNITSHFRTH